MDKLNKRRMVGLAGLLLCLGLAIVYADVESTTVTFVIPSDIDHSVSYGGACSSSLFYFVETDSNKDGTQTYINVSSDTAGATLCENTTQSAMIITNIGSVAANVSANFSAALPSGIVVKVSQNYTGYGNCNNVVNVTDCANVTGTANVLLTSSLTAQTGTANFWWFCDMSNFNSGVATAGVARTLQTTAIQS